MEIDGDLTHCFFFFSMSAIRKGLYKNPERRSKHGMACMGKFALMSASIDR